MRRHVPLLATQNKFGDGRHTTHISHTDEEVNQSINQSIIHSFVLSNTKQQVNAQYSVEQDTKA